MQEAQSDYWLIEDLKSILDVPKAKIDSHKTFDSLELSVNVEECAQRNDKTNRTGKTSRKGMVWIFLKQKLRKEYGFRKPQSGHQQVWRAVPSRLLPRCRLSSSSVYECISEDSPTSPNRHPVPASSDMTTIKNSTEIKRQGVAAPP
ncbi:hypothetical protein MG293_009771 [Ovis ammon polii]|uniref:Uncharacterized protein n=1 Tax=Ovis ammon polii TaxID=230172 RepID=A0AAD4Y7J2_OVIAM|nr:hypothetical protein MG293_009771 [Ovis ammon polii]